MNLSRLFNLKPKKKLFDITGEGAIPLPVRNIPGVPAIGGIGQTPTFLPLSSALPSTGGITDNQAMFDPTIRFNQSRLMHCPPPKLRLKRFRTQRLSKRNLHSPRRASEATTADRLPFVLALEWEANPKRSIRRLLRQRGAVRQWQRSSASGTPTDPNSEKRAPESVLFRVLAAPSADY